MLDPSPPMPALNGVGTCVAWADLLKATIDAHGIPGAIITEVESARRNDNGWSFFPPPSTDDRGLFLVKNWSFTGPGTAPPICAPFAYLDAEVADNFGAAGQGSTTNPPAAFFNHFILKYVGTFYDPSYGTLIQVTQGAWEMASLDGYKKLCDDSGGMLPVNAIETAAVETVFIPPP